MSGGSLSMAASIPLCSISLTSIHKSSSPSSLVLPKLTSSTAAAIRVVTCGGGGEVLDRQDAAACRSCACEDDKTEGGCCRQDRCWAGPAEARRAGRAAAGVLRPGGTVAAGAEVCQRGGQRAGEAERVDDR